MRPLLISAIAARADARFRGEAKRFLRGLSLDELQYLAEYLGACTLEANPRAPCSRRRLAESITYFDRMRRGANRRRHDQEHKMIVALEYLCLCELTHVALAPRTVRSGS